MTRTHADEFSKKTKLEAWQRSGGRCECCGIKIMPGNGPEYDHKIEVALGGDNSLDNCQVLAARCHKFKSTKRQTTIAKVKRIVEKAAGARKSSRPMPCGRNSPHKKTFSGKVVPR